jgi:hypothetical protein
MRKDGWTNRQAYMTKLTVFFEMMQTRPTKQRQVNWNGHNYVTNEFSNTLEERYKWREDEKVSRCWMNLQKWNDIETIMKKEALDRTLWRTCFERGYEPDYVMTMMIMITHVCYVISLHGLHTENPSVTGCRRHFFNNITFTRISIK